MNQSDSISQHKCDFCACEKEATLEETYRNEKVYLCEDHWLDDKTGYCGLNCQLGYGCGQEC